MGYDHTADDGRSAAFFEEPATDWQAANGLLTPRKEEAVDAHDGWGTYRNAGRPASSSRKKEWTFGEIPRWIFLAASIAAICIVMFLLYRYGTFDVAEGARLVVPR